MFIPTKACEEVESLINTQNLVIVVGQSGSGKSAIIQHIALKYRSQGWAVKPVTRVDKIIKDYESNNILPNKTLFVINDPIGKESFDEIAFASWKENDLHLRALLKNSRMLLSCRKCVQCDIRAKGFFEDSSKIIDIDSGKCILSDKEKRQILNKYNTNNYVFSETDLEKVLKTKTYFPLLCKLFFSDTKKQKDGVKFFMEPVEKIKKEIRAFKYECKEKYCALILIVLFNNALCIGDVRNDENSEKLYEHALKLCGMNTYTAPFTIRDALETLKDGFVSKKGNAYQFCHDLIMEITSYVFGSDYPRDMIKYAHIRFLRKRVKLEGFNDKNDLTIQLDDIYLDSLGKRLLKEMFGKHLFDVVLNPCLKNGKVVEVLKKHFNHNEKDLKRLLKKYKFSLLKQKFDHESNDASYGLFKFSFLCSLRRISPLCALIVFGHTDFSLYCFKSLTQLNIAFKDDSIFFAVCSNGSMTLFNEFEDDEVENMIKISKPFNAIHIASHFNKYEILRELIRIGVDVNVGTPNNWTPLILAVTNFSDEGNTNYLERKRNTVLLLLSNNACVNSFTKTGESPLNMACKNGYDSIVQLLLHHRADINLCCNNGPSPLSAAMNNLHFSTAQLLIDEKADTSQIRRPFPTFVLKYLPPHFFKPRIP